MYFIQLLINEMAKNWSGVIIVSHFSFRPLLFLFEKKASFILIGLSNDTIDSGRVLMKTSLSDQKGSISDPSRSFGDPNTSLN